MIKKLYPNSKKIVGVVSFFALVFIWFLAFPPAFSLALQSDERPFTIALLPDTQMYKKYTGISRAHIFDSQTRWIADHFIDENIVLTLHLGDVVDVSADIQWVNALDSLSFLDDLMPVVLTVGNHDIAESSEGVISAHSLSYKLFNKYFPEDHFNKFPWFGGVFEKGKIENAYYFFNFAGVEYLVLVLEYGPRDKVLDWANKVVEEFSTKKAIIVTHAYLAKGSKRLKAGVRFSPKTSNVPYDSKEYEASGVDGWANGGDIIWEKLVKRHENIEFVFSAHSGGPGKLISKGIHGNSVFQVGANYQWEENGGNGYLRLMKFYPKEKKVTVKTYSPLLDHFRTDLENQFLLDLEKGKFLKLESLVSP